MALWGIEMIWVSGLDLWVVLIANLFLGIFETVAWSLVQIVRVALLCNKF